MQAIGKWKPGFWTTSVTLIILSACSTDQLEIPTDPPELQPPGTTPIEATMQNMSGDPSAGWDYLRYGDYLYSGFPYDIYRNFPFLFPRDLDNVLDRAGLNENVVPEYNVFESFNGVQVVSGLTCFACHGSYLNGEYIPGLGNSFSDFTANNRVRLVALEQVMNVYGRESPEWEAFTNFYRGGLVVADPMVTPFKGINPAFTLARVSVAHRVPETFEWTEEPGFDVTQAFAASDVPPMWNVDKKNALYYTALGRGDMTKHLMTVTMVMIPDTDFAQSEKENFEDVLAWMRNIQPPAFPEEINTEMADEGLGIFTTNCAKCHGHYSGEVSYPNLLVDLSEVGTDPLYAQQFSEYETWYNNSWASLQQPASTVLASPGYIAPPLDGIWATAPYLHNGSVPNLATLLNSPERPDFWKRDFSKEGSDKFDFENVGWMYEDVDGPEDTDTYDTSLPGYGNQGHTYADHLTGEQRMALIEYLKTL